MTNIQDEFNTMLEKLKTEYDEISLQIHLGKSEVRDEWQEVERKWHELRAKGVQAHREALDSQADISAATKLLAVEIRKAIENIRNKLK